MAITVTDLLVRVRAQTAEAEASLGALKGGLAGLGILAAGAVAAAFVKMGMDAQTQLSIVAGLTGSSKQQMDYYTSALEGMGAKFGMTLSEAAKGLYYVVSAGYQGTDAINVLTTAMQHSAATGVPLQDVANGLTSAMNAYSASASEASRYSDILTTAITYGKQTTADFANNVSKAALMASAAHVPFTQLAAAESALTEKGEPANRAFTELSFMMSKIAVPSADAMAKSVSALGGHLDASKYQSADLMGKLLLLRNSTGLTTDEFLKLIGGTRSARGALGLLSDGGAAYNKILTAMGNNSGVTAKAFEIHTHTMQYGFDTVKAAVSNAAFELVKFITPAVVPFLTGLAGAVQFVTTHAQQFVPVVAAIGAAIAVLLVPPLVAAAGAMTALDWPLLLIAAGIGLLVAGVVYAYQNFKPFRDIVNAVGQAIQTGLAVALKLAGNAMAFLHPYIVQAQAALAQFGGEIATRVMPFVKALADFIKAALPVVLSVWNAVWPSLSLMLMGVWNVIVGIVKVAWALVSGIIKIGLDILSGNWKAAWNDLKSMLSGVWDGIQQVLKGALQVLVGNFTAGLTALLGTLAKIPGPIGDMAKGALSAIHGMVNGMNDETGKMASQTGAHATAAKVAMLTQTAQMHQQAAHHYEQMRQQIIAEMAKTTDPVKKHALAQKLAVVTNAEQMEERAATLARLKQEKVVSEAAREKAQVKAHSDDQRNIVQKTWDMIVKIASTGATNMVAAIGQQLGNAVAAMGKIKDGMLGALGDLGGRLSSLVVSAINNMIGAIGGMAGNVAGAFGNLFAGLHMPHFASGGTMAGSGLALVGEHGPEVVALPGGSRVFPHGAVPLQGGGSGGSGAMVIHVHSHNYLDGREVTQGVMKHLPAVARLATGQRV